MNEKVKQLGCTNTNFTNPHGYHDENHYSTAYDMATIFRYCLKNDIFREIINTNQITIKAANSDNTLNLKNGNRLQDENYPKIYYKYVKGGKTGYTIEARGTLICYGQKNDKTVIVATFDGSQNINGYQARYLDSTKLFDYSFENYKRELILNSNDYTFKIYDNKNNKCYTAKLDKDIYGLVNDVPTIQYNIDIDYNKIDNICNEKKSENNNENNDEYNIIGKIKFKYEFEDNNINNNEYNLVLINSENYYTTENISKILPFIIIFLFVILITLVIYYIKKIKNNNTLDKI